MIESIINSPEIGRIFINSLIGSYLYAIIPIIILQTIISGKSLYSLISSIKESKSNLGKDKGHGRGSKISSILDILNSYRHIIIGGLLTGGAWFITSLLFFVINLGYKNRPEDIDESKLNYEPIDAFLGLSSQGLLDHLAIIILGIIFLSGIFYTVSFGNKIWKRFAQLLLLIAFLIGLFGFYLQVRVHHIS